MPRSPTALRCPLRISGFGFLSDFGIRSSDFSARLWCVAPGPAAYINAPHISGRYGERNQNAGRFRSTPKTRVRARNHHNAFGGTANVAG